MCGSNVINVGKKLLKPPKDREKTRRKPEKGLRGRVEVPRGMSQEENDKITEHWLENETVISDDLGENHDANSTKRHQNNSDSVFNVGLVRFISLLQRSTRGHPCLLGVSTVS